MTTVEDREGREPPGRGGSRRWNNVIRASAVGLAIVLLITTALFASRGSEIVAFLAPRPPQAIIVIVADALRADAVSCYNHVAGQTPQVDALARDGVLYRHAQVQAAWTKASVATLLTSLYPSTHQALCFDETLPDEVLTLPEVLAAHDYRTVGFVSNLNLFPAFNFQQGFGEYYALDPDESSQVFGGKKYYQEAELVNRQVLAWLDANQGKPNPARFFMYIHYMDPHDPYFEHPFSNQSLVMAANPDPDPALASTVRRLYDGEVSYLDTHLGELFAALKRLGLYDDALIVFTADHGEEFYEHQGWGHGKALYEETTAVPLIIKYPGNPRTGTVDEGLARSLDVAPTILDVAGIERPAAMRGVSLRLPPDSPDRAQFSFTENFCQVGALAVRTSRYKLIEVIDGDLRGREPTQLYDLEADPGETVNLASAQPDLVARLRAQMSQTLALAERAAIGGQKATLDPAFRERLRRLGY